MNVARIVAEEYEKPMADEGRERFVPTRVFFMARTVPAWYKPGEEAFGYVYVDHYNPCEKYRTRSEALAIAAHYGVALIERCMECGGDAVMIDGEATHLPPQSVEVPPDRWPCAGARIFLGVSELAAA